MQSRVNACDTDWLQRLADGSLPATEIALLEAHLQACAACQTVLDQLTVTNPWLGAVRRYLREEAAAASETDTATRAAVDFLAPSDWPDSLGRIGAYEVKGLLGRGGMGVVLKAVDPALNRTVAIKVLSAHLANCGAARQRFLREARAAAAVMHEHVVAVHAVDDKGGLPYLVMEYVSGRSLQERLDRQGPLTIPEILRIGMQAAAGLAAAHAQGLVHRDVKPANILLENGVERARLTDFGLARAVSDAALTQSGVVTGTPQYMAPEQARGEAVDHRADLFSLGSTLYAMCTGHPPFRAESAVAVLRRVSDGEPRPIREINAEVPVWLEAIIARLHAKDPAQRFQTASEVAELLGRCLSHWQDPLSVPLPSPLAGVRDGAGRWFVSARWAMSIVVLVSVFVATCLALLLWPQRETDSPPPQFSEQARPSGSAAQDVDDIETKMHTVRGRAATLEADLNRHRAPDPTEALSSRIQEALHQARLLEQQLRSGDMAVR
jgi:serine/threonine protein kinase